MEKSSNKPWLLLISVLGVVYGDIGTSPIYALKSSFMISNLEVTNINVLGVISLFIGVLFIVVTIKYGYIIMNIDKKEEKGGVLVLSILCSNLKQVPFKKISIVLGIIGAALLFGDGALTPAISVLSALEGLNLLSPGLQNYIIITSIGILTLLFAVQRVGSNLIGIFFGPIMLIWFFTLAVLGVSNIIGEPSILRAFNPYFALYFMTNNGITSFKALSGVFLVITGAEALYANCGYFGNKPIQLVWNFLVFPSLVLNYLGQGSLLLRSPELISNPFYYLVPTSGLYPLIILATCATIIASQAMISGVFSIISQAIKLDYLPKFEVLYTSLYKPEQVYVPIVNMILYILTIVAILIFQTSVKLSFAYGLSASGVMLITTILVLVLLINKKHLNLFRLTVILIILFLDCIFVLANIIKITEGAWYALLITAIVSFFMWRCLQKSTDNLLE